MTTRPVVMVAEAAFLSGSNVLIGRTFFRLVTCKATQKAGADQSAPRLYVQAVSACWEWTEE
jgi:hypothetical protein